MLYKDRRGFSMPFPKGFKPEPPRKCRLCGARLSPFMGEECWEDRICQNCVEIQKMERDGTLAKNGLCALDLMF